MPRKKVVDPRLAESAALLEEAMAELERTSKELDQLRKVAAQLVHDPSEQAHALEVARRVRLMADPDDGETVIEALARRIKAGTPPATLEVDLKGAAQVEALMGEAQAELERLQKELEQLPDERTWRQIRQACGRSVDDGPAVLDLVQRIRRWVGEEHKADDLDDAVEACWASGDIQKMKAEALDKITSETEEVALEILKEVLDGHTSPLREVWNNLSAFERRRLEGLAGETLQSEIDNRKGAA